MLRKIRRLRYTRWLAWCTLITTLGVQVIPADVYAGPRYERRINWNLGLKPGLTQTLTPKQRQAVERQRSKAEPASRPLSAKEMQAYRGSGPYRNKYFSGVLPWQR